MAFGDKTYPLARVRGFLIYYLNFTRKSVQLTMWLLTKGWWLSVAIERLSLAVRSRQKTPRYTKKCRAMNRKRRSAWLGEVPRYSVWRNRRARGEGPPRCETAAFQRWAFTIAGRNRRANRANAPRSAAPPHPRFAWARTVYPRCKRNAKSPQSPPSAAEPAFANCRANNTDRAAPRSVVVRGRVPQASPSRGTILAVRRE